MALWGKKSKSNEGAGLARLIEYPPQEYVRFVADFVDNMDPATRSHVAVAYQNLIPIASALFSKTKSDTKPYTIESLICDLDKNLSNVEDEINSRRRKWFAFAAIIARLEKVSHSDPSVIPLAATIWTIIITEYPRLKVVLPNNIVWKPDEKIWFDLTQTDSDLIQTGINHHIPPKFAAHDIVKRFAKDLNVFYWPSDRRIGFIA